MYKCPLSVQVLLDKTRPRLREIVRMHPSNALVSCTRDRLGLIVAGRWIRTWPEIERIAPAVEQGVLPP